MTSRRGAASICKPFAPFLMHNDLMSLVNSLRGSRPITTICLAKDGRHLLANIAGQGVQQWDLRSARLLAEYDGCQQQRYIIRAAFGGHAESFVVCGSEGKPAVLMAAITLSSLLRCVQIRACTCGTDTRRSLWLCCRAIRRQSMLSLGALPTAIC
jgi:hypothetical protein